MSPEQAEGGRRQARRHLGVRVVLHEMITGKRPFKGDDISDTLASVLRDDPDWTALPASVPPSIRALLEGCLKKDRRERFGDISTPLFLLNQPAVLTSGAIATPAAAPSLRPLWKRTLPLVASALVGAALAGAVARIVWPSTPTPSVTRFPVILGEGQAITNQGRQAVAISPDGAHIAYTSNLRLSLRALSDLQQRAIAGTEDTIGVTSPVFSPDGKSIVFYSISERALKRVGIAGGAVATICPAENPYGMSWTGDQILYGQGDKGIWRVAAGGGKPELVVSVKEGELAYGPQQLPGGQAVLFTLAPATGPDLWDKAQVVVQDLKSGQRTTLLSNGSERTLPPDGAPRVPTGGVLFGVRFDPDRLTLAGNAVPVIEGVGRALGGQTGVMQFSAAENGTVAYISGPVSISATRQDLARMDREGVTQPLKLPPAPYEYPRVSPDGKQLAVGTDDGKQAIVWIYGLSGTNARRQLTFGGNNRFPIWSGDSTRVAFQSDREGDAAIFWQRADGTGTAERLTKPEPGTSHIPESWSPDSKTLLFVQVKGSAFSLWSLSLEDKQPKPYSGIEAPGRITAAFSPDGRWVAYSAFGVSSQTYVEPFPATGEKHQVPIVMHPIWSPDMTELFGRPPGRFLSVKVVTKPSFTFSNPVSHPMGRLMMRGSQLRRNLDILPDGKHFVGVVRADEGPGVGSPQIQVVEGWFEELKAKAK